MQAIGIDPRLVPARHGDRPNHELKLLYVGDLLYLKGLQLALPALASVRIHGAIVSLTIVGEGPLRSVLEEVSLQLDLAASVEFRGKLPLEEVYELYQSHDVFLFPSLRDSGGIAVLEAMAAGLPVVCLALGGPGMTVTNETGILIEPINPSQVIRDLAAAIIRLSRDPKLMEELGKGARSRVEKHYAWDRKGDLLQTLYRETSA
jgi:glycosyltransferase involved in cell wall biosynthesis